MTKREARSACRTVGKVMREQGKRLTRPLFASECADRRLKDAVTRVGGPEIAFANAVNGWTEENKRRVPKKRLPTELEQAFPDIVKE